MKISFSKIFMPQKDNLVIFYNEDQKISGTLKKIDIKTGGQVIRSFKNSGFTGKKGQNLEIISPNKMSLSKIFIIGIGKVNNLDRVSVEELGGKVSNVLNKSKAENGYLVFDKINTAEMPFEEFCARILVGIKLGNYQFNKFLKSKLKERKNSLKDICLMTENFQLVKKEFNYFNKIIDGVFLTRNLVSEPSNELNPKSFADITKKLQNTSLKVDVLTPNQIKNLKMNALLGVAQGSVNEPRVVVFTYNGAPKSEKPLAFIGKGVTFDSGGISIKPSQGMEDMKWDMGGAGVVTGLMAALSNRKAKVNVVGVIGLVENMPSGSAQRPGDVVQSMSGQTIEVINTDAEGRLVLADILWYAQKKYKPKIMIDLATLTGAIIVALGEKYAGLFSNNDLLAEKLMESGKKVNELVWRFPLSEDYDKLINSNIADVKNVGSRGAGSITAAQFLQRFVNKTTWAHIDIAGVTWTNSAKPTVPKGGTGFGVRLLDQFIKDNYEK